MYKTTKEENEMSLVEVVKTFLIEQDYIKTDDDVLPDDSLLEKGIIDSVGILNLVKLLEEKFSIEIDDDDLMPENFDSLAAIEKYVKNKTS